MFVSGLTNATNIKTKIKIKSQKIDAKATNLLVLGIVDLYLKCITNAEINKPSDATTKEAQTYTIESIERSSFE
jgi:hypothetical protein